MRYALFGIAAALLAPAVAFGPSSGSWVDTVQPVVQPDTQPTTEPATQPASGPATRPATGPASGPASGPATQSTSQATTTAATGPATQPEEKRDRYFAVTGGIVHTIAGPDVHGATVLCKNGRIETVGKNVTLPEGTETLDVTGMHVYPGLIACHTQGIVGSEPPENNTDVFSTNMTLAVAGGLTTVVVGNTAAKTTFGGLEEHVLRKDLFVQVPFNNSTRKREARQALEKVRQYLRDKEAYERKKAAGDKDVEPPDDTPVKGPNAKYLQLIKMEKSALIAAESRGDLADACRLARDFGIRVVIRGATEGWTAPGLLGRAGVKAIVTPRNLPWRDKRLNRPNGGSIENAAILHEHGVPIAIVAETAAISLMGIGGRDLLNLPIEAAYAVRGGLSESAAIEAVTLSAARVLGVDDRVGSIEVGKDADLIVCDGELLSYFTTVHWTVVNGRIVYDKAKDTLFAHIRPRVPTTQPTTASYKFWPRPFKPALTSP